MPAEIRSFLTQEDDFGHEVRVGKILRSVPAVKWEHGGTYIDPITEKPRQFDYRWTLRKEARLLCATTECKNLSPNVPLVVCGTQRAQNEAFHELIESVMGPVLNRPGIKVFDGPFSFTWNASGQAALYPESQFVGKSTLRLQIDKAPVVRYRSQDSDIYDKWAQAISSAEGLVKRAKKYAKENSLGQCFVSVIPMVVVPDDTLWIALYDDNGGIPANPIKANECALFIGRHIDIGAWGTPDFHRFTISHIHFFTLSGFSSFVSRMASNDLAWAGLFTDKAILINPFSRG